MESSLLHHYENYRIRSYDVDSTMRLSIPSMIQILHDAATKQVIDFKLSALELRPVGLAWMLTHQYLEIFSRPLLGATVKILTHPSGRNKIFTFRDYHMFDENGKKLCQASTTWILVDIDRKRSTRYPERISQILAQSDGLDHLPRAHELEQTRPRWSEGSITRIFEPGFLDMDFNGHVSNHYFFKWMLATLPDQILAEKDLRIWNVRLKNQVFAHEQVISEVSNHTKSTIDHRLTREEKVIAEGYSTW